MLKKLTKLLIASLLLILVVGCVSPYQYFPEEPVLRGGSKVIRYTTNDTYEVSTALVNNYVKQIIYIENISDWRKNNGIP